MANPYGIEQVDVPGALNALEVARSNRIRQMMLQRQLAADERTLNRQTRFDTVLAGALTRGTGGAAAVPAAYGAQSAPAAAPAAPVGMADAYAPPSPLAPTDTGGESNFALPAQAAPPAAPVAPAQPVRLSEETISQLIAIDPEQGSRIATAVRQMDEAQVARLGRAQAEMARLGRHLLSRVPEAEWAAEIQRRAPELMAHGVTQQMIANFQPTRPNVEFTIDQARDIEKIIEDARPRLRNVGPGDTIIDERNPSGPPIYESPVVMGPGGVPYARPDSMRASPTNVPPQPGEVRQTSRGPMRFRGGDHRDQNNYEPVQGGAGSQAPQTFP